MSRRRGGAWAVPALLVASFTAFSLAWIWGNPLGSAPDELDHYTRALAVGHGQLVGAPAPSTAANPAGGRRIVTIPAGLASPPQFACDAFNSDMSAVCADSAGVPSQVTEVESAAGLYLPTGYVVPGLLMRLANDPYSALRLGRLGSAFLSLSLLAVAAALLWSRRRSPLALAGLLLATTPMQLFLLTEVGPNGLEIAAAICYAAALLRLARPDRPSRWNWAGLAFAGVVLAATRPLGPEWIVLGVVVVLCLVGPVAVWGRIRARPLAGAGAALLIVAAAAVNLAWQARNPATAHVSLGTVLAHVKDSFHQLPTLLYQSIGVFGWLDTPLPTVVNDLWAAAVLVVTAIALVVGTPRQRIVLIATSAAVVAASTILSSYLSLALGFKGQGVGVQGRYLMPLAVWWPLLAAEIVQLQHHRLRAWMKRPLLLVVALFAAAFQLYAWLFNERRYAVGIRGPLQFMAPGAWSPPGGWPLWLAVAATACALVLAAGVTAARSTGTSSVGN